MHFWEAEVISPVTLTGIRKLSIANTLRYGPSRYLNIKNRIYVGLFWLGFLSNEYIIYVGYRNAERKWMAVTEKDFWNAVLINVIISCLQNIETVLREKAWHQISYITSWCPATELKLIFFSLVHSQKIFNCLLQNIWALMSNIWVIFESALKKILVKNTNLGPWYSELVSLRQILCSQFN